MNSCQFIYLRFSQFSWKMGSSQRICSRGIFVQIIGCSKSCRKSPKKRIVCSFFLIEIEMQLNLKLFYFVKLRRWIFNTLLYFSNPCFLRIFRTPFLVLHTRTCISPTTLLCIPKQSDNSRSNRPCHWHCTLCLLFPVHMYKYFHSPCSSYSAKYTQQTGTHTLESVLPFIPLRTVVRN